MTVSVMNCNKVRVNQYLPPVFSSYLLLHTWIVLFPLTDKGTDVSAATGMASGSATVENQWEEKIKRNKQ